MRSNPQLPFIRPGRKPSPASCSRSKAKRTSSETRLEKKYVFELTRIPRSRALQRLETRSRLRLWKEAGLAPFQNIKNFLLPDRLLSQPRPTASIDARRTIPQGSHFTGLSPDKDIPTCSQTLIVETVEDSLRSEERRVGKECRSRCSR